MSERCVPRAQLQFAQIVVRTILNAMPRSSGATRPRNGNLPARSDSRPIATIVMPRVMFGGSH
jgi:hypothetical protein